MSRIAEAAATQRRALEPAESVWVAASAGTGKTKVLTDRLLSADARRHRSGPHPVPDLHPRRRGRDGQPDQ